MIESSRGNKVKDVLSLICPSAEFAEEALEIIRDCLSEITNYPASCIDLTAYGGQVDLWRCNEVKKGRAAMDAIETSVLQYLQEQ